MRGYDATGITFGTEVPEPFALMFSRSWHDLLGRLFGVAGNGYMSGGLHHHDVGSANGAVHNDLNPGWFERREEREGVTVAEERNCAYKTGYSAVTGLRTVEQIRGVAMLFYLNNPEWSAGDGGETGLYWHATDPVDRPATRVPPINNSLLAFECTPYSYHSFISNHRHTRDSLVLWIHRSKREVLTRWGDGVICYWRP
jgi:hypothetical protein